MSRSAPVSVTESTITRPGTILSGGVLPAMRTGRLRASGKLPSSSSSSSEIPFPTPLRAPSISHTHQRASMRGWSRGRGHRRAQRRASKDAFRALGQCDREQSAWEEQAVADAQEKRDLRHFRQLPIGQLDVVVTTRLIVLPSRANWAGEPRAGQGLLVNRPIGRNIRLLTFVPVFL